MMVTKDRFEQAKIAIRCFQNQTYNNKELLIVDDDQSDRLANYINQLGDTTIRHLHLKPQNQTLGELRNIALENTLGSYVCQWDDDDLADPLRLEMQMSTLQVFKADACFLQRWLMWWLEKPRLATSRTRIWEGSLLCRKDKMPSYPNEQKGEDTLVTGQIIENCRVALLDQPQLYLYTVHSRNTFNKEHFEQHWRQASIRYTDGHYYALLDNLATRMPIIEYIEKLGLKFPIFPTKIEQPLVTSDAPTTTITSFDLSHLPRVLILTPVKNAIAYLPKYLDNLLNLSYPHDKLSLGFLESDSVDGSFQWLEQHIPHFKKEFRFVYLFKQDFNFQTNLPRWDTSIQFQRRSILAKSRNRLLQQALTDEDWVLWLDVDVIDYPKDVIQQLLQAGKNITVPHCVVGEEKRSFDLNTFRFKPEENQRDWTPYLIDGIIQPPRGEGRLYLEDMRDESITKVDSVGGTMLMIKADLHRDGLLFPSFSYKQYIETEGLAMMAKDMGYSCWALPNLEIVHASI
jgi:glycosyltransferase involved in cell wall biosynthesis